MIFVCWLSLWLCSWISCFSNKLLFRGGAHLSSQDKREAPVATIRVEAMLHADASFPCYWGKWYLGSKGRIITKWCLVLLFVISTSTSWRMRIPCIRLILVTRPTSSRPRKLLICSLANQKICLTRAVAYTTITPVNNSKSLPDSAVMTCWLKKMTKNRRKTCN